MTDSIRVPLGDQWRHVPTMYDGSWGLRAQTCNFCGAVWPCDAEVKLRERNALLDELALARNALDAATARALAAEEALTKSVTELGWAAADAHVGWLLYEADRGPSKHAKEYGDCTVEACAHRRRHVDAILAANRTASGDEG